MLTLIRGTSCLIGTEKIVLDFGCIREFRPELADGVLKMLQAVMNDDFDGLVELYETFGFGQAEYGLPSTEVLREYHGLY